MPAKRKPNPTVRRRYQNPVSRSGIREPKRDQHNFADVDRALTKWLLKNDPTYKPGCIPAGYIDYNY